MTPYQKNQVKSPPTEARQLITHASTPHEEVSFSEILDRIQKKKPLTLPLERTLKLAHEMKTFALGQYLLSHGGLNGYWTSDMILTTKLPPHTPPLETWIRTKAPMVKATRERFHIFQREIVPLLRDNITLASIPCGLMDCLLRLDYTAHKNISFIGLDLDEEALDLALGNALNFGHDAHLQLILKDAWEMTIKEDVGILISNGLTIYEPDQAKILELYKKFHRALKPGGTLITSFLTPPPIPGNQCPWRNFNVDDLLLQKSITVDILDAKFRCYLTEEEACGLLANAGFRVDKIVYDSQSMFPTVVAKHV